MKTSCKIKSILLGLMVLTGITGCTTVSPKYPAVKYDIPDFSNDKGRIVFYQPKGPYTCRQCRVTIPKIAHPEGTSGELAMMDGKGGIEAIILGPKNLAILDENGILIGYKPGPGYIKCDVKRDKKMEISPEGDTLIYSEGKLIQVCKKGA